MIPPAIKTENNKKSKVAKMEKLLRIPNMSPYSFKI